MPQPVAQPEGAEIKRPDPRQAEARDPRYATPYSRREAITTEMDPRKGR
jgi:hypothetical protein